ncbi:MAG: PorT family protein [Cytophagales bacterium]|nr:PorT family protein [Cytophagales bacterium]
MKQLLLLAALAVSTCGFAQISIIPKVGVNVSNAAISENNDYPGQKSLLGLTAGLGINFPLTSDAFLSVQPEILYSQKGWAGESSNALAGYEGTYRLNYLEVPLLLKINFGGETIRAYVNAGPSFGYLLGGRVDGRLTALGVELFNIDDKLEFTETPSLTNLNQIDANRTEIGLNFGGGAGYSFGGKVLFVDVRYNLGLSDYNRSFESKNRVFALTAGLQIPLGE